MNIVFVTTEYTSKKQSSGGLATFTRNVAGMFAAHGNNVRVLLVTTKAEEHDSDEGVVLENLYIRKEDWEEMDYLTSLYGDEFNFDHNKLRANIVDVMKSRLVRDKLEELNRTQKIDIVHFCNHGALFRLVKDIPYVVRISGLYNIVLGNANTIDGSVLYNHQEEIRDVVETHYMKKSQNVICPSHVMERTCRDEFGITCKVIQSPVCIMDKNDWDFSVLESQIGPQKYFLYFGTINFFKGLGVLMNLVHDLLSKYFDYVFVLAGRDIMVEHDGKEKFGSEFIKECAKEHSDRVIALGSLISEQLFPVISKAELCILPGRIENLSNACLEAMAIGKIVVATKDASYEEIIDDGIDGFLCERDNAKSFFDVINHVMNLSDEERASIYQRIRQKISKLTPSEAYSTYFDYYQSIIENSKRP